MVVEKDKLLAKAKEDVERVKVDRADANVRAVAAYHDGFEDMSEYKDLAHHFMTAGGEQLVKKIMETHPEWVISFLKDPPDDLSASEDHVVVEVLSSAEPQDIGEAQTLILTTGEGPQCADLSEAAGAVGLVNFFFLFLYSH
ncbi:hypothetical protein Adt_11934 [Abeliophyllum distichum]|uniref:Uncharacterized protein n=1 Tax=Abeliophyllum distichum TaxID=126358 RepID=A0ABD1UQR2_9LAMI